MGYGMWREIFFFFLLSVTLVDIDDRQVPGLYRQLRRIHNTCIISNDVEKPMWLKIWKLIWTYKKFNICIPLVAPKILSSITLFLLDELVHDDVLGARRLSRRKLLISAASNWGLMSIVSTTNDIRFCINLFFSTSPKLEFINM